MERDDALEISKNDLIDFNSHAHVERDKTELNNVKCRRYFNSHAHVERDRASANSLPKLLISTHTLTWSVTIIKMQLSVRVHNFNSHAHVERDNIKCSNFKDDD